MVAGQNIEFVSVFTYMKSLLADISFTRYYEKVAGVLIYGLTCFSKVAYSETSR
jgi:hypothetical protein